MPAFFLGVSPYGSVLGAGLVSSMKNKKLKILAAVMAAQTGMWAAQAGTSMSDTSSGETGYRSSRSSDMGTGAGNENAGATLSTQDRNFIREAAASNISEVKLARLAQQKSSNPEVKNLAQQIIDDHSQANRQLQQLASNNGINIPSIPPAESSTGASSSGSPSGMTSTENQPTGSSSEWNAKERARTENQTTGSSSGVDTSKGDATYQQLSNLSGKDFDKAYAEHMVDDHRSDIQKFENEAQNAKDPQLKSFASQTVSKLRNHLQMAETARQDIDRQP